jgi:hypothetical protein
MSHSTVVDSIVITNIRALRAAIKELTKAGVKCDLLENAVPRAYDTNQKGLEQAPFVIQLHGSRYDVGLYHNRELGGYECRADFWSGDVAKQLGSEQKNGVQQEQAWLGKLYQTYGVVAAEQQAAMQGYSTARTTKTDGTVQLVLTAA